MSRLMFITVGTSLFQSASWGPNAEVLKQVTGYQRWLKDELLRSPDGRIADPYGDEVRDDLRKALTEQNGPEWAGYLPEALLKRGVEETTLLRYSAEMTTILAMAAGLRQDLRQFLLSYDEVRVLVDGPGLPLGKDDESRSRVAGIHLTAYLNAIAATPKALCESISGLSSTVSNSVLVSLKTLHDRIRERARADRLAEIDIVVSGGYKIYGAVLGRLARPGKGRIRLLYLHESGRELIAYDGDGLEAGLLPTAGLQGRERLLPLEDN